MEAQRRAAVADYYEQQYEQYDPYMAEQEY